MSITLCFFAKFREKLATQHESYTLPKSCEVKELLQQLAQRGGVWQELFDCPKGVLVAINQDMASLDSLVNDGDEVAFFPPVTGG